MQQCTAPNDANPREQLAELVQDLAVQDAHPKEPARLAQKFFPGPVQCLAHGVQSHDVFISYRVAFEGKQCLLEPPHGAAQFVYDRISGKRRLNGNPIFVFQDSRCLNYGQNWRVEFINALLSSLAILLLISNKSLEEMVEKAKRKEQDNVLLELECALVENKLKRKCVIPVFLAESVDDGSGNQTFNEFKFPASDFFPNEAHSRNADVQTFINTISEGLADTMFLDSISETMKEIFELNGVFLSKRCEDPDELKTLDNAVMDILNK